ncbi:DNA polymerase epsilon subunit 3 [Dendrobium catenatum]|uniref:Nuclear transcription factor Y subunit B-1 n=1 Tax=Dendrobium catenatum TaxID=906689 RepID=A0A2I0V9Y4_9ASPA|nr:DNA polymerase epsilon subunit 3 [Dendrobium catenatum]PKU60231.1 Nuclear transcription factor Y subunit B-1 [Dendrobium catenatum]
MAKGEAWDGTAATPATSTVVEELPKTIVRRVVKEKLFQLSSASSKKAKSGEVGDEEMMLHKDALIAFSESARIFIHYLSATANDICKESRRQTINAEDVFKALDDMEFTEFIQPLRDSLEEFRKKNAGRKSGTKGNGGTKKRKSEEELPHKDENEGNAYEENN